ncbi:g1117 [Coccomyxa elongata]
MGAKRKAAGELSTSDLDALKEIVKSSVEDIMDTKLTEFCTNFKSEIRSFVESVINEKFEAFTQQNAQQLTTLETRHASEKEALTNKITAL